MGCDGIMEGDEIYNGWLQSNMPESELDKKYKMKAGPSLLSGVIKATANSQKQPVNLNDKRNRGSARN